MGADPSDLQQLYGEKRRKKSVSVRAGAKTLKPFVCLELVVLVFALSLRQQHMLKIHLLNTC